METITLLAVYFGIAAVIIFVIPHFKPEAYFYVEESSISWWCVGLCWPLTLAVLAMAGLQHCLLFVLTPVFGIPKRIAQRSRERQA